MKIRLLLIYFLLAIAVQSSSVMATQGREGSHNSSKISAKTLSQMEVFARIAVAVQFFHPSDEAKTTDWENLVASGMREIENSSSRGFNQILRQIFSEIAPTMSIDGEHCSPQREVLAKEMMVWQQNGYIEEQDYDPKTSAYKRERAIIPASDGTEIDSYIATYGDTSIKLPLAVYIDEKGQTLPKTATSTTNYAMPRELNNRYVCLSAATKVWGAFQHYYPYFDSVEVDWNAELPKLLQACETGSEQAFFSGLRTSLTKLQDNHINVLNQGRDLSLYTVPIGFDFVEGSLIAVYKVEGDSSEVEIADELIEIDGISVTELLNQKKTFSLRSSHRSSSEVALNYLIRREKAEAIRLTLKNKAGDIYSTVLKASHHYGSISWSSQNAYSFKDLPLTQVLEPGIQYVNLSKIKTTDVDQVIAGLANARALVLDLRNYPADFMGWWNFLSHFSTSNLSSLPMFYHVPAAPDRNRTEVVAIPQEIEPSMPHLDIPVVALSSKFSISQNEHALGFVQSANIPILGERTFGINGNVTYLHFMGGYKSENGFSVTFTGMELRQHDNSNLIGVGIIPNVEVGRTAKGISEGIDEQLTAAVSKLRREIGISWKDIFGPNEFFVGKTLVSPAGEFPYALKVDKDGKRLSTPDGGLGFQSFELVGDRLDFSLQFGTARKISGSLPMSKRTEKLMEFESNSYGKQTKVTFEFSDSLSIETERGGIVHARVQLIPKSLNDGKDEL